MTDYRVSRTIAAPAATVWAILADGPSYPSWNPAVVRLDGDIEAGSTIELVSVVNPKRTFRLTVAAMDPPRSMVWADGMPLGLFRGERTFSLDEADGATTFTMSERYAGPLAPLITRAIPDLTESFEMFADGLKAEAEARHGG